MSKLRYGIIGAGWVADLKHLPAYASFPEIELVAICNHRPERAQFLASKYGIPHVFSRYEEMFAQCALDIVSICSTNALHLPMMEEAIRHGVHIHCEKPVALNEEEVDRIISLNADREVKIFVGMNYRYETALQYLKQLVLGNEMGHVYHMKALWHRRRGIPGLGGWFTTKELSGGGPLIDLGVHLIDSALHLLNFPDPLSIQGQTYSYFNHTDERINRGAWAADVPFTGKRVVNVEDMAVGLIKFDNGSTFYLETTWAANVGQEQLQFELYGTKAGAKYDGTSLEIYTEWSGALVDVKPELHQEDPHQLEVQAFLRCILENKEPECNIHQAKKVMHIIDQIYKLSL